MLFLFSIAVVSVPHLRRREPGRRAVHLCEKPTAIRVLVASMQSNSDATDLVNDHQPLLSTPSIRGRLQAGDFRFQYLSGFARKIRPFSQILQRRQCPCISQHAYCLHCGKDNLL
jgi:hypothetical protein